MIYSVYSYYLQFFNTIQFGGILRDRNMENVLIKARVLDTCEINSLPHSIFTQFEDTNKDYIPCVIGVRSKELKTSEKSKQSQQSTKIILQFLTTEQVEPINISKIKKLEMYDKMNFLKNLIEALQLLESKGLCIFLKPNQKILAIDPSSQLKLKFWEASPTNSIQVPPNSKPQFLSQFAIELVFDGCGKNQNFIEQMHMWRWGLIASSILFSFETDEYLKKLTSLKEIIDKTPELVDSGEIPGSTLIIKTVQQSLNMIGSKRPKYSQALSTMMKLLNYYRPKPHNILMKEAKSAFLEKQQKIMAQYFLQFGENSIFSEELKKKTLTQFVKMGLKPPKQFKPIYSANKFKFSHNMFYSYCSKKANLLFVIDAVPEKEGADGRLCVYLAPALHIREEEGLFGHYIADSKSQSFIYSVKNQESYKLGGKQKAFRYCPGMGPVIGDGDLILNGRQNSECNFPCSFQTGKHKKLPLGQSFILKQYEVYQVK